MSIIVFNSCPSLKGNHLSFKSTDDSNNNKQNKNIGNYVNTNLNNFSMNKKPLFSNNMNNNMNINNDKYQNYLSMQNLFLNLNPYTASLMRNNFLNKPQHNSEKNLLYYNNKTGFNNKVSIINLCHYLIKIQTVQKSCIIIIVIIILII